LTRSSKNFVDFPQGIGEKLFDALLGDASWEKTLHAFHVERNQLHIAVMAEPYLLACMEGKKTIESRFSSRRIPPYGQVKSGDVILMKQPGGPIVGVCEVSDAWFYRLDPEAWKMIKVEYLRDIYADNQFWVEREDASYATLIRIKNVRSLKPFAFAKRDRRGWVILKPDRRHVSSKELKRTRQRRSKEHIEQTLSP